jgi:tetratricopeptide (TPR) repeat protein
MRSAAASLIVARLILMPALAAAQDPLAEPGFVHFYNLEFDDALAAFHAEAAQLPDSADVYNHIAQTILYREMFRSGALESQLVTGTNPFLRRAKMNPSAADDKLFDDAIARAMELAGVLLKANPSDAPALYAMGVSYGLRSNYKFLVHKAWVDALHDATSARKAHHRATEVDPDFKDALLVQGLYDYIVGSLPFHWKTLGFLAGFRGNRERGIETLQLVADKGLVNRADAAILLCAIYRREKRAQDAIPYLDDLIRRFPRNFLLRLELVQMYGDLGDKAKAMEALSQLDQLKRSRAAGLDQLPEEKIRYTRGNLLFWYNDLDAALEDMKAVTAKAGTLDLNTGVYAWLRLGEIYDLKGQHEQAIAAYRATMRYAPGSEAAREARDFMASPYKR